MRRLLWALCTIALPWPLKRHLAKMLFGWEIHPTAYIGRSVILVRHLRMEAGASIGPFNVIKDVEEVRMAEGASIASRNWITGFPLSAEPFPHSPGREPVLVMGKYSMITVAHEIDCSDRVELGDYAAIAGFGCAVLTHSLDLVRDRFITGPVSLGHHSAVMSGCTLLNGTTVPSRSFVSAGSVVNTKLRNELTFYGGNPAEPLRQLPESLRLFDRGRNGRHRPFGRADVRQ